MILVDSSVWLDFFNGRSTLETDLLDGFLGNEPLLTGDLILTEVLQGFRADGDFRRASAALATLTFEPMVGREIAIASAQNYRRLRTLGVTVRKTIDVIIATFCVENGHRLLHADRDFALLEEPLGLRTVHL